MLVTATVLSVVFSFVSQIASGADSVARDRGTRGDSPLILFTAISGRPGAKEAREIVHGSVAAGFSQWVIYARSGLEREYMGEEWLDFVFQCRKGEDKSEYDIVIGGIADDKIFKTIDLYFTGDISKDEALRRLKYEKPNNQYCLRTQRAIDLLIFKSAEEITK